jgi:hypothetical protein
MGLEMLVGKLKIGMNIRMKTRMGRGTGGVYMAFARKRPLICSFLFK